MSAAARPPRATVPLLVKRALDHSAVWHKQQRRKYPGFDVPYVSHPAGVALLLARHGFDDEVVAAGALHDVMEDCDVPHAELARLFGARVADLVRATSEPDKSLTWEERKRRYLERFAQEAWDAQAISVADKIDNFDSILVSAAEYGAGATWQMFKRGRDAQVERFEAMARVLAQLPLHPLLDEFAERLAKVKALGTT
jgi:(p)ppGpp synthase/HD superfamily hydrolase